MPEAGFSFAYMESNWVPFGDTFIHICRCRDDDFVLPRLSRKEKDINRRWLRALNRRVRWHPSFAQHLQGQAIMRGVFAAARRRA